MGRCHGIDDMDPSIWGDGAIDAANNCIGMNNRAYKEPSFLISLRLTEHLLFHLISAVAKGN